jgi:hypothetical protein
MTSFTVPAMRFASGLFFTNEVSRHEQKNKGGEAPKGAYHLPHQRARRVLKRRTLAFRRFTAALVPAVYRQKLSPGRASRDGVQRCYRRIFLRA